MPASHQRQPKLRDSCDHCSNSKVRCDSESCQLPKTTSTNLSPESKPSCLRCREKGFQCEYSPARRIGRVRSKTLKSISDDVKFRLPKGDVHSASSSPPDLTEEMESPPLYSSSPEEWNDSWTTSPPMQFWQKSDPFAMPQHQQPQHGLPFEAFSPTSLEQTLVSQSCILPQLIREGAYIPLAPPTTTDNPFGSNANFAAPPPQLQDLPMPTMETSSSSSPPQPQPQRQESSSSNTSTSDDFPNLSMTSSGGKQIDDDFNTLITFADSIESKFDVFVRRRLSEQEGEGEPDQGETSFYNSLAELKRRLKWLREDVRCS